MSDKTPEFQSMGNQPTNYGSNPDPDLGHPGSPSYASEGNTPTDNFDDLSEVESDARFNTVGEVRAVLNRKMSSKLKPKIAMAVILAITAGTWVWYLTHVKDVQNSGQAGNNKVVQTVGEDPSPSKEHYRGMPVLAKAQAAWSKTEGAGYDYKFAKVENEKAEPIEKGKELSAGDEATFGGVEFVWIPKGSFIMGSPSSESGRGDNELQHKVTLTKGFWLGKYEVTQLEWESVMGTKPSSQKGPDLFPIGDVSYDDIQGYLRKKGSKYRLPTEAEWEYACRAGTTTATHYGDSLSSSQANFDGNTPYGDGAKGIYLKDYAPVGSYKPNAWGLYDMHGNMWEWCNDKFGDYPSGHVTDPTGPTSGESRVLRGGMFLHYGEDCRSAERSSYEQSHRSVIRGFRVARTP